MRKCASAEDVRRYTAIGTCFVVDTDRFTSDAVAIFVTNFGTNCKGVAEVHDIDLTARNLIFGNFAVVVAQIPGEPVVEEVAASSDHETVEVTGRATRTGTEFSQTTGEPDVTKTVAVAVRRSCEDSTRNQRICNDGARAGKIVFDVVTAARREDAIGTAGFEGERFDDARRSRTVERTFEIRVDAVGQLVVTASREQVALDRNGKRTIVLTVEPVRTNARAAAKSRRNITGRAVGGEAALQIARGRIGEGAVRCDEATLRREAGEVRGAELVGRIIASAEIDVAEVVDTGVSPLTRQETLFVRVAKVQHDVAAAVRHVGTGSDVGLVTDIVTAFSQTVLCVGFDAFEVGLVDEVYDASDSVRTVKSRSAAGQDIDTLDELGRNDVEVDRGRTRERCNNTATVDQNERAVGAKVAKVDGGNTGTRGQERGVRAAKSRRTENGVFEQQFLNVGDTGIVNGLFVDDLQRCRRFNRWRRDARTGHDDRGAGGTLVGSDGILSHCRLSNQREAEDGRRS